MTKKIHVIGDFTEKEVEESWGKEIDDCLQTMQVLEPADARAHLVELVRHITSVHEHEFSEDTETLELCLGK